MYLTDILNIGNKSKINEGPSKQKLKIHLFY